MSASQLRARAVCRSYSSSIGPRQIPTLLFGAIFAGLIGALMTSRAAFAATDVPQDVDTTAATRAAPPADTRRLPSIGVGADAGLPDGLMASLVLRPSELLRLHIGAGSNTASPGVRAGLTFLPLGAGPSLTLEGGHYIAGDASGLVGTFFSGLGKFANYVGKVGYSFANLHAGLDLGTKRFTFFIHGGVTYLRGTVSQLNVPANEARQVSADGQVTTFAFREDPVLRMWAPSLKLGLVFYLQ
jgi:hypothetical protein